jgi:hypothetical protein
MMAAWKRHYLCGVERPRSKKRGFWPPVRKASCAIAISLLNTALRSPPSTAGSSSCPPARRIFDSLKNWIVDIQGVTKDQNGLGTTFSSPVVL